MISLLSEHGRCPAALPTSMRRPPRGPASRMAAGRGGRGRRRRPAGGAAAARTVSRLGVTGPGADEVDGHRASPSWWPAQRWRGRERTAAASRCAGPVRRRRRAAPPSRPPGPGCRRSARAARSGPRARRRRSRRRAVRAAAARRRHEPLPGGDRTRRRRGRRPCWRSSPSTRLGTSSAVALRGHADADHDPAGHRGPEQTKHRVESARGGRRRRPPGRTGRRGPGPSRRAGAKAATARSSTTNVATSRPPGGSRSQHGLDDVEAAAADEHPVGVGQAGRGRRAPARRRPRR